MSRGLVEKYSREQHHRLERVGAGTRTTLGKTLLSLQVWSFQIIDPGLVRVSDVATEGTLDAKPKGP